MPLYAVINRATASCVAFIKADTACSAMAALVKVAGEGKAHTVEQMTERQIGFTHVVAELPQGFDPKTSLQSFAMLQGLAEGPSQLVFFAVRAVPNEKLPASP